MKTQTIIVSVIATVVVIGALNVQGSAEALITESALLVKTSNTAPTTGELVLTAKDSDCRLIAITANVQKKSGTVDITPPDDIWSPGVTWTFKGKICLCTNEAQMATKFDISAKPMPGGSMGLVNGRLVSSSPIQLSGSASVIVPPDVAVLEIQSDTESPLVFMLTPKGLEYMSGVGSVKAPGGKTYDFAIKPKPDESGDVPPKPSPKVVEQAVHPDWPLSPFLPTLNAPPGDQVVFYICLKHNYIGSLPGKCPTCGKDLDYYERDGKYLWPRVKPGTVYVK